MRARARTQTESQKKENLKIYEPITMYTQLRQVEWE